MDDSLVIVGRVLLGGLFVIGGMRHFGELDPLTEACRARRIPFPRISLIAASLFQIVAGALLMIGLFVPWAALGLIVFTLVASAVMVDFWNQEGERRTGSINVWLSNLALIGGLLIAAAQGTSAAAAPIAQCASPTVELAGKDRAFASNFARGSERRKAIEANVRSAFQAACAKRLIQGAAIPNLDGASTARLFLENWPDANIASLEADQLPDRSWRLMLGHPFVASDGSVNVPSAADIEEAIYCAVRGATEQEQAETGRCLVD